jgi:cobalt-zinc-cadmium efflux system membrane fusion protein
MTCLKYPIRIDWPGAAVVLAVAMLLVTILLVSCGGPAEATAPADSSASSNAAPSDVTVELSSNQLSAIKIGPVETYLFPVTKEAVGSISFEEDPAIVQAESTLLGAAGTVEVTSNELARARSLYETNGVAQRELEQAISDEQTAEAALKAARDAVRALGKTDAEIDQMIATGAIGSAPAGHGSTKWLLANVMESDSPLVQAGLPVKVTLTAFPGRVFAGQVSKIYATIDPNLHRLPVRCEVDDPKDELRPGMLASVTIQISEPVEATAVPANGIVREGDGTLTAWVTADRRHFTQRTVKTGIQEDGRVQILSGLDGDNLVVTNGAVFLDNMINAVPSD